MGVTGKIEKGTVRDPRSDESAANLHQCQNPNCDHVLSICKMLSLEKLDIGYTGSLSYFLQLHLNLQNKNN